MAKTRIYEVPVNENGGHPATPRDAAYPESFLVEASSQAQASGHVAKKFVGKAFLPIGKRIAQLMASGHKVESAVAGKEE